jgi:glycosyltransferase involved in cell wall biosynthesis
MGHGATTSQADGACHLTLATPLPHPDPRLLAEWAKACKERFPFLSENVLSHLNQYRFEEHDIGPVTTWLRSVDTFQDTPPHPSFPLFREALSQALRSVWQSRPIDVDNDLRGRQALVRVEMAACLDMGVEAINIGCGPSRLGEVVAAAKAIKARANGKMVCLHFAEVFSRRSETFIYDLLTRLRACATPFHHVLLCDERLLEQSRPYADCLTFAYDSHAEPYARICYSALLDALAPDHFIFHFALNGWTFLRRAAETYLSRPMVFMTHGIDVFDLYHRADYRDFLVDVAAKRPNVRFTAVSEYLTDHLIRAGVPSEKIDLVHNSVHDRFFLNRRSASERAAERLRSGLDLRIVNVGRPIPLKGQSTLLAALAMLKHEHQLKVHVTIVLGDVLDGSAALVRHMRALRIVENVRIVDWVDFDAEPDFYTRFDVLVSASTHHGDHRRSESFGLTILEAIAAGLPVVVTNAGGQPEVVGAETMHSRLVPPDDPAAMARALVAVARDGALETDNLDYAVERLTAFSAATQIGRLLRVCDKSRQDATKVALFSTFLTYGAGSAARRVHKSLVSRGVASTLFCREGLPQAAYPNGVQVMECGQDLRDVIQPRPPFLHDGYTIFSIDGDGVGADVLKDVVCRFDVINVHWYARFLSVADIGWLSRQDTPLVITLRDMYPLAGGCHYFHGCDGWKNGCFPCPQFIPHDIHLPAAVFQQKRDEWNTENITVVVLSDHSKRIVEMSPLLGGCRIVKIPNPVDLDAFVPVEKAAARRELGLPEDCLCVAYLPSFASRVKGGSEACHALRLAAEDLRDHDVVVLTAGCVPDAFAVPFPVINLGSH